MPSNRTDAVALSKCDHRRGDDGLRRLVAPHPPGPRRTLADRIRMELMIHSLLGDEVFHPSREGETFLLGDSRAEPAAPGIPLARIRESAPSTTAFATHGPTQGTRID